MAAAKARPAGARKFIPNSAFASRPHLRLPELFQKQLLKRSVRAGCEVRNAPRLAVLPKALNEILHRLLVTFESVAPKGHLLNSSCFAIDELQIAECCRIEFVGRQNLDDIDLKTS